MPTVYSEAPSGGDRVYLDALGAVVGLTYTTDYPGGASTASLSLDVPLTFSHRAVNPGRRLVVLVGVDPVWTGRLEEPEPGEPWSLSALGLGTEGDRYRAVNGATVANALDTDVVTDAAIARGLPWRRLAALPAPPTGLIEPTARPTVAEALQQVAEARGLYTVIGRDGAVTLVAEPTAPAFLLLASELGGARSLAEYANALYVAYLSSVTRTRVLLAVEPDTGSVDAYSRRERLLDMTGLGEVSEATALAAGRSLQAKVGARLSWTGTYTAAHGDLLTTGGVPVDLASADVAGQMVRTLVSDPPDHGVAASGSTTFVVGRQSYDAEADLLTLTPRESSRRDLASLLSPSAAA